MDFLFHEVNEKERKEIQKQAKSILDDFSSELDKAKKKVDESFIERDDFEREEGKVECSKIDRKVMFDNAKEKNKDFIIAEKKKW